jgi:tetratricopeptide (TPR) repeat protein
MSLLKWIAAIWLMALTTTAQAEHLGTVSFAVSCAPAVQADFNRGVALLHDFWYAEAQPQFERILKSDPGCAMAHWGVAMSGFHQIWGGPGNYDPKAGWKEMRAAQAKPAKTAREREYINALATFFHPGKRDYWARIDRYAADMSALYAHYPEDVDAGAFYALALLAAHVPHDKSLKRQHQAMSVLSPLWEKYPDHPGLMHYIIHACDNVTMANDGLAAARRYGEVASSGPHAAHMPGHIFATLGMWQEDIDANLASLAASQAAEAHGQSGWMDQFHADDFLVYAYLQSGQEARARDIAAASQQAMDHYRAMPEMRDNYMVGMFPTYEVRFPVMIALETRDWPGLRAIEPIKGASPDTQAQAYWARVLAEGHLHQLQEARSDLAAYNKLMDKDDSIGTQIVRGEMLASVAAAAGDTAEAVKQMRASADLQDKAGQDEVDIPARELLADLLLESGQAQEALLEYKQDLQLNPNRFNGLYGAGKAAEALGSQGEASSYYAALLQTTDNGSHSAREEIGHARAFMATRKNN